MLRFSDGSSKRLLARLFARCGRLPLSLHAVAGAMTAPDDERCPSTPSQPARRGAMPAPASSSAASESHAEWLASLQEDYARRMALAAAGLSADSPSGHAGGASDMGGFQPDFEVTGEAPVYRSFGIFAGSSSEGPSYRNAGQHNGRHSAAPGALSEAVDAEWKRSLPPLLMRQSAFTVS